MIESHLWIAICIEDKVNFTPEVFETGNCFRCKFKITKLKTEI